MACKIAVLRQDSGRKRRGDCVQVFDIDYYLGKAVEPKGGMYVVIEVSDCEKENETMQQLTEEWALINPVYNLNNENSEQYIYHETRDRKYYLQPVMEGDQFFADLFNNGRIRVTLEKVKEYIRERT